MNENPIAEENKLLKIRGKSSKYFWTILILLILFFITAAFYYNVRKISDNRNMSDILKAYNKIPATIVPKNPLCGDADKFVEPRKDFIGTADQLNDVIKNIEKHLDGKFDFDEYAKEKIWKDYSKLLKNLEELSAKAPSVSEAVVPDIPGLFFTGGQELFSYITLINRAKISALLASTAIGRKDFHTALHIDLALTRIARAAAVASYDLPSPFGIFIQYDVATIAGKGPAKVYLECDEALIDPQSLAAVKEALKVRGASIPLFFDIRDALRMENAWSSAILSIIRSKNPLTMSILDMWYGRPENYYAGMTNAVSSIPKGMGAALVKSVASYHELIAGASEYSRLKLHPHFSMMGFADYSKLTADAVKSEAFNRLITLGGLSRIYCLENGGWPELDKNKEFLAAAGMAALDPADGKTIRAINASQGAVSYYSIGPDGEDNGGDETRDVVITIKRPAAK
ncbi:MAG TPA: hypothetical protein PK467_03210 [Candidatus Wallbacteria bacterium]|nr:hypothetical protein [Candidatus Wallbacteria bacterium]